jgi:hypothetical protein
MVVNVFAFIIFKIYMVFSNVNFLLSMYDGFVVNYLLRMYDVFIVNHLLSMDDVFVVYSFV